MVAIKQVLFTGELLVERTVILSACVVPLNIFRNLEELFYEK